MTNYSVKTVDEFVTASPEIARPHLQQLRRIVLEAVPGTEEMIGYGKPSYKYHGWMALFDTYTHHIGFEIWDGLTSEDRKTLEDMGYRTGSKAFQIRYDQSIPTSVIEKLVKAQAKLNEAKVRAKSPDL